jgi:hypothetical protein
MSTLLKPNETTWTAATSEKMADKTFAIQTILVGLLVSDFPRLSVITCFNDP